MNVIDMITTCLIEYFKDKPTWDNKYEIALSKDLYDELILSSHPDLSFINPSYRTTMTFKGYDVVCDNMDGYRKVIHIRKKNTFSRVEYGHKINKQINYITIADRVINGEFGNGLERKNRLEEAGYDYNKVQTLVNENIDRVLGIKNVKFNGPATIVFWMDGTKTVVKCSENDVFDQEKGLAMAIIKKMSGNDNSYHKIFKKWCEEEKLDFVTITDYIQNLWGKCEEIKKSLQSSIPVENFDFVKNEDDKLELKVKVKEKTCEDCIYFHNKPVKTFCQNTYTTRRVDNNSEACSLFIYKENKESA